MKKKMMALLTSMTLVLSTILMGCGSQKNTGETEEQQTEEASSETAQTSDKLPEKFKIGVVIWSTTDDLGGASARLLNYASDIIGCEMVYNTNISSPESQITATENLIAAGCNAIAICNYSDDILPKITSLCEENEVYFTLIWRSISDPEVKEIVEASPYYLGNTCESEEETGYMMGESFHNMGCENIAVITMEKGDATADARDAGFDKACDEFGMNRISEVRNNTLTAEETTKAVENFLDRKSVV